ncbi:dihydropteroate synthase [Frigidibacter albus]|nr:dihydropteroate synthase [Frigidibacter albus]
MYYRPIAETDAARPPGALTLAGGWCWFDRVEVLSREGSQGLIAASDLPGEVQERLTAPRPALAGLAMDRPQVMGILNVTPDSFSDGGRFLAPEAALARARKMQAEGMAILDIGGESTRPGAPEVSPAEELARTGPVIAALRDGGFALPVSIDTRKGAVAAVALQVGANLVNDVSGLEFDPALAGVVADAGAPVCLMHSQGTPATMHLDPRYGDVLLDVYDALAARVAAAEAAGIPRARICIDPGIGFGKTLQHNLTLLRGLSLFHGLGCPILLGVSRKRFIGSIGGAERAEDRAPGTLALTLAGLAQGAQIHRVHDVAEVTQGIRLWQALQMGYSE